MIPLDVSRPALCEDLTLLGFGPGQEGVWVGRQIGVPVGLMAENEMLGLIAISPREYRE